MSLKSLKALDITTVEEEKMIQEIMLSKATTVPVKVKFNEIVPDIKTKEDEEIWQAKIDDFKKKNTPIEAQIADANKVLDEVQKEIVIEIPLNAERTGDEGKVIDLTPRFCETCTSKGVRHKKECPKYTATVKTKNDKNTVSV